MSGATTYAFSKEYKAYRRFVIGLLDRFDIPVGEQKSIMAELARIQCFGDQHALNTRLKGLSPEIAEAVEHHLVMTALASLDFGPTPEGVEDQSRR